MCYKAVTSVFYFSHIILLYVTYSVRDLYDSNALSLPILKAIPGLGASADIAERRRNRQHKSLFRKAEGCCTSLTFKHFCAATKNTEACSQIPGLMFLQQRFLVWFSLFFSSLSRKPMHIKNPAEVSRAKSRAEQLMQLPRCLKRKWHANVHGRFIWSHNKTAKKVHEVSTVPLYASDFITEACRSFLL